MGAVGTGERGDVLITRNRGGGVRILAGGRGGVVGEGV